MSRRFVTLVATLAVGASSLVPLAASATAHAACGSAPSAALAGIADGLSSTWGTGAHPENRRVLTSALASERTLRACGDERGAVSVELIAADAYGDVFASRPGLRCGALRDARSRTIALGDRERAALITSTLADCGSTGKSQPAARPAMMTPPSLGSASGALAAIADGLSSTTGPGTNPEDKATLHAALASAAALRRQGHLADAASAELVAADAYSDVMPNAPAKRCAELADARRTLRSLGDTTRAALVERTIAASPCGHGT